MTRVAGPPATNVDDRVQDLAYGAWPAERVDDWAADGEAVSRPGTTGWAVPLPAHRIRVVQKGQSCGWRYHLIVGVGITNPLAGSAQWAGCAAPVGCSLGAVRDSSGSCGEKIC